MKEIEDSVIVDIPLPLSQDFALLQKEGLGLIQVLSGKDWTNLNPSDPGVTILEQVCYALTELGYCNDFPIKDILTTRVDEKGVGKITLENQFFLSSEILTCSPITINDYRKYIIDNVESVENVVIIPVKDGEDNSTGNYQVFLKIISSLKPIEEICSEVFYLLHKVRNLGEKFSAPQVFIPSEFHINGEITITKDANPQTVLSAIHSAIEEYIFPSAKQYGYQELLSNGEGIDEIYNGPLLQNGWMRLGKEYDKKDQISVYEIRNIVTTIKDITAASITLSDSASLETKNFITTEQIAGRNFVGHILTVNTKSLTFKLNNVSISVNSELLHTNQIAPQDISVKTDQLPILPQGDFRDINAYYSIQNTFPDIYAVGRNATESNASDFSIAQSRQLKGYLTLFDQVLANQFSQLANLDKIFSFENSISFDNSDLNKFYATKDIYQRKHLLYPVPYLNFAPTYFAQSLYDIPNIRPLLKDESTFNDIQRWESSKEEVQQSWDNYKDDPYNTYILGLRAFLENENVSFQRRDDMLDHLLARHGMAPVIINAIIDGSSYTGNLKKDKIVFKSLLLQNLALLSYYKQKGYNPLAAAYLKPLIGFKSDLSDKIIIQDYTNDFILRSKEIDESEKLEPIDFTNFSTFELKAGMLLGLKPLYNFSIIDKLSHESNEDLTLLYWLIEQRKGFLFIEIDLLFESAKENNIPVNDSINLKQVEIFFPNKISVFIESSFQDRLALCMREFLPVFISANVHVLNDETMSKIINAYIIWHNSLIYVTQVNKHVENNDELVESIKLLVDWITENQK